MEKAQSNTIPYTLSQSKLPSQSIRKAEFESYAQSTLTQGFISRIAISTLRRDLYVAYLQVLKTLTNQPKSELEMNFPRLREEIRKVFENNLGIKPESITLYKSPEDGEERIIVSIKLGQTDSPLKKLLEIKRKLRKIDRDLASKIVLMPAD